MREGSHSTRSLIFAVWHNFELHSMPSCLSSAFMLIFQTGGVFLNHEEIWKFQARLNSPISSNFPFLVDCRMRKLWRSPFRSFWLWTRFTFLLLSVTVFFSEQQLIGEFPTMTASFYPCMPFTMTISVVLHSFEVLTSPLSIVHWILYPLNEVAKCTGKYITLRTSVFRIPAKIGRCSHFLLTKLVRNGGVVPTERI